MRLASLLAASALFLPFASFLVTNTACGPGSSCNCPTSAVPQAVIALPCDGAPLPALSLSGVCAGVSSVQDGQLYFGSYATGTCHVAVTYPRGTTYAADVEFVGQWLPCGSDAHGCGEEISVAGLANAPNSFYQELVLGPACADSGVSGGGGTEAGPVADAGTD